MLDLISHLTVGQIAPYVSGAITVATVVLALLPPPAAGGNKAYAALYNVVHIIGNLKKPVAPAQGA